MSKGYSNYEEIPILEVAKRCGIVFDSRTLDRTEVEAACPFCGDKPHRHHLFLNTVKNQYYCWLCGASGNSVSLYARLQKPPLSFGAAARELLGGSNVYRLPQRPQSQIPAERPPRLLAERHEVFLALLKMLVLSDKHRSDLRTRGLTDERVEQNLYRSLPESEKSRMLAAEMLADFYELDGIPGFFKNNTGKWTLAGKPGLLIPYRDQDGCIQGLQIRLDDETNPKRKYRWFASTNQQNGTKSGTWVHVVGNTSSPSAFLLEGALKGDVVGFFDPESLFICFAGVNAIGGLQEVIEALGVKKLIIAGDMDKVSNWRVRNGLNNIVKTVSAIKGVKIQPANWNVSFKGLDDYYLTRSITHKKGMNMSIQSNSITTHLLSLWKKEYPRQDPGFIRCCEWEEKTVPLSELVLDPPQGHMDMEKVRLYMEQLEAGAVFPPIVCVNGFVIDGFHRCQAYRQVGVEAVRVYQNIPWEQKRVAA